MSLATRAFRLTLVLIAAALLLQRGDLELEDTTARVRVYTREIEFDFTTWTLDAISVKVGQVGLGIVETLPEETRSDLVLEYLDLVVKIEETEAILNDFYANPDITDAEAASELTRRDLQDLYSKRDEIAPLAEAVFQSQLGVIAAEMALTIGGQPFPPVMYHISPLPSALIVSPREVIRQDADISLKTGLTVDERAALESQIDQGMDVSSLVVNIGGMGSYPTMVMQTRNINWLAEVISHEWTHNILTLRPLGANYYTSPELRTMNETAASIAGNEMGAALIERFYPQFAPPPPEPPDENSQPTPDPDPPPFDFRAEMRETRVTADALLAEGKIDEAEAYMESRRRVFWDNGYRIRKLNQAYFAFHGAYADIPGGAAGEDPVGEAVRNLRVQSSSLSEFLNRISWMWSFEQLQATVDR